MTKMSRRMKVRAVSKRTKNQQDRIGHFGCAHVDGVVSVEPHQPGHYPKAIDVICPAGHLHAKQDITWRNRKKGELGRVRPAENLPKSGSSTSGQV